MANAAELQKQLADLMKVMTEKHKLQQKAEAQMVAIKKAADKAAATNLANTNALVASAVAAPKKPKMGLPDKFNGTQSDKAAAWVKQIGIYIFAHPNCQAA
ncbi:hypothetical protein KEM48_008807 [Puccinia striiformis f. sp. tritici PST-130]|nr:hypothetical protein KEM48_008807 [Puccinia striiformis f. sp. tritici PST-130]